MIVRMLMFNLIFVLLFNVLSDWYFYKFCICRLTKNRAVRVSHWILDSVFIIAMAILFMLVYIVDEVPHSAYQTFFFFYVLIYIPKVAYMIFSFPAPLFKLRFFYWIGAVVCAGLFVSIVYGGTIGRNSMRVTEVTINSDKLPNAFKGYKIVQLSDAHLGNMSSDCLLKKLLREIEIIQPDIIIFSGDLVHSKTSEAYRFREILSEYTNIAPVYTVLGNHDYGDYSKWKTKADYNANLKAIIDFYKDINWTLMNNSSDVLRISGDSIALIGVENWGEKPFPQYGKLDLAMDSINEIDFKILITHNPKHWSEEVKGKKNIVLTMSGHTHAMQLVVSLFGKRYSPASWKYDLWGGLYSDNDQYLYVNEGLGVVLFPFRLGATPELTVITLDNEKIQ